MNILPPVGGSSGGGTEYFPHIDIPGGPYYFPGRGYNIRNTGGNAAIAANVLTAVPYCNRVPGATGVAAVVVATAAGNARFGFYNSDPVTGLPTTLLVDAGVVSTAAAAMVTLNFGAPMDFDGLYWAVMVTNVAPSFRAWTEEAAITTAAAGQDTLTGGTSDQSRCGLTVAFAYAALPATFPVGAASGITKPGFALIK
jgi:hypothetical protein